jgi:hypothetical protein
MGTETYPKSGQVSQKEHDSTSRKSPGKEEPTTERYLDRYDPVPVMCEYGAPDAMTRKYFNQYKKTVLG